MTATDLKNYRHAAPFVPFNIVLSSGERVAVPHPDFLTVSPAGTIAHVWKRTANMSSLMCSSSLPSKPPEGHRAHEGDRRGRFAWRTGSAAHDQPFFGAI